MKQIIRAWGGFTPVFGSIMRTTHNISDFLEVLMTTRLWHFFCTLCLVSFIVFWCDNVCCFEGDSAGEFTLDIDSPQFSDLSDEQKSLVSEFSASYRSLVQFYENVRIDAELLPCDSSTLNSVKYIFRARGGDHFRMDTLNSNKPEGGHGMLFVTPNLFSAITRNSPTDEFYVSEIRTEKSLNGIGDFYDYQFWMAPYSAAYMPMKYRVFMRPGFADHLKIAQLSQQKDGIDDLVTIETQYFTEGKLAVVGTFTFYRNLCWAVKETKWELVSEKETRHTLVEYSGDEKGMPLISKVTYWHTSSSDATPVDQIAKKDVYLCKVFTDPVPYSDFDVRQYVDIGLPRPKNDYFVLRLVLVFFGIVFIVWGFALRYLKKRV